MKNKLVLLLLVLLIAASTAMAQGQKNDEEYTKYIKQFTTEERFLTPLVDHLPASDTVPSPLKFHGYIAGAEGKQTYYADLVKYYRALDAASERMTIFEVGKSHRGETMIIIAIADEETIANLDQYREYTKTLADPRSCSREQMQEILGKAKPFYLVSGGLHSPETGSPEMLKELAYRLIVDEGKMIKSIREKIITLIVPVLEIDGWNRQVDWYYRHTKKVEKYEDIPRTAPPFWGNYTAHDNNRDGLTLSQPLSKNINKAFFMFYPQVTHDLHESVPLLYISTGTGPYYTSLDPVVRFEWQWLAFNEVTQLTSYGVPGVWTHGFYTGWYPGYVLWLGNNHNSIGRFYETFGNGGANTFDRDLAGGRRAGFGTTETWYRPSPAPEKLRWSLRNNTNVMETGVLTALDFTARNADTILTNFWTKGNNAIVAGKAEKPYAWIIPASQKDNLAAVTMLGIMDEHRIELQKLTADFTTGERTFKAGDVVVRMDQPYRNFAKTLMEIQKFPEGEEGRPYDATSWTFGLMFGVETVEIDDAAVLEAPMAKFDKTGFTGTFNATTGATRIALAPQGLAMIRVLMELKDVKVVALRETLKVGETEYPAGTWLIDADSADAVKSLCDKYRVSADEIALDNDPATYPISMPRLAFYEGWFNTQEPGWARFALDTTGIPYTILTKDDVKAGALANYDVLIVPDHGGRASGQSFMRGVDSRFSPLAYTATDEFKFHGTPVSAEDITGGLGFDGTGKIESFVQNGGTLIALGSGSRIVTDFGLLSGVSSYDVPGINCSGAILTGMILDGNNPVVAGYGEYPPLFRRNRPLLRVDDYMEKYIVAQFGTKREENGEEGEKPEDSKAKKAKSLPLWKSGLLERAGALDGSPAILDVPLGKGRIVLFGFDPLYRWMSQGSFAFVHNAIMAWQAERVVAEE